ncbi:MAG: sugar ABC transporter permease, partial [Clostridia bacterium]|nr:sugar ABC transporter permease [Clostridia bacterium]
MIFYVYVNFNTILLAFQEYSYSSGASGYDVKFAGFDNFISVIQMLGTGDNISMIWNSLLVYVVSLAVGTTLALFFSYYIYKKYFMSGVFQVFLFLPQVLSSVVLSLLFKYMVTDGYMALTGASKGLLDMPDSRLGTLLFFHIWASFGANILIYSGAMSGINESVVESAQLEGVNALQEFWYITLP